MTMKTKMPPPVRNERRHKALRRSEIARLENEVGMLQRENETLTNRNRILAREVTRLQHCLDQIHKLTR